MSRLKMIKKSRAEIKDIIYSFGNSQAETAAHFNLSRQAITNWIRMEQIPIYVVSRYEADQKNKEVFLSQIEAEKSLNNLHNLVSQIEKLGFKVTLTKVS